tara:strand:- start:295 stop:996 length:702 start_codon:yes stop_codon:yes gene_type:complete
LKLIFKLIKSKLVLFLLIFFGISNKLNQLRAEKYEIYIRGSNIDFVLRLLKKADKRNAPKILTNADSSKSITYKKNNFQRELSKKELIYLIKNPQNFYKEQIFVKDSLKFLNQLGVSVFLVDLDNEKGSAYWLPEKKSIKIDSKTINAGSLTFAKILNHEMIHIAQSCKGGAINSFPRLIGLDEKMNKEKIYLLSSKVYKNLTKYQISLEKEAYSYQDNLSVGKYLINKFCDV